MFGDTPGSVLCSEAMTRRRSVLKTFRFSDVTSFEASFGLISNTNIAASGSTAQNETFGKNNEPRTSPNV